MTTISVHYEWGRYHWKVTGYLLGDAHPTTAKGSTFTFRGACRAVMKFIREERLGAKEAHQAGEDTNT